MSQISNVGVILYKQDAAGVHLLFNQKKGVYSPASQQIANHSTEHISHSAAKVLGPQNYQSLLNTIQNYKQGVTKLHDTKHHQVLYLAPYKNSDTALGELKVPDGFEWVPLREVQEEVKAYSKSKKCSGRFSSQFLKSAPLLLGKDSDSNLFKRLKHEESVSGVLRGNPKLQSKILCDLRDSHESSQNAIDAEFMQEIDGANNLLTIEGQTYQISFKQQDKEVSLNSLNPTLKAKLLTELREAIQSTAPVDQLPAINQIVFNFQSQNLANAQFFGSDPDNPLSTVDASDPALSSFKDRLSKIHQDATKQINGYRQSKLTGIPFRGVPNYPQTSWLGVALHSFCHSHGKELEEIENEIDLYGYDKEQLAYFKHLLLLKRKIFKEVEGSITISDLQKLQAIGENFDTPSDFTNEICSYLALQNADPVSLNILNHGQANVNIAEVITESESSELRIHLNRKSKGGKKNSKAVIVPKRLTMQNDDVYELVSATIHHGDYLQSGHYTSLAFKGESCWSCNDRCIETMTDAETITSELQTQATDLVYRKITTENETLENSIAPLHSYSKVDTNKWLGKSLLFDYAQQLVNQENAGNPDRMELLQAANGSSYKIGSQSNISSLGPVLAASTAELCVVPTHKNGKHWTLMVIDKVNGRLEYFDSVGREPTQDVLDLATALGYQLVTVLNQRTKWQNDGWRCGLYTLKYLELRTLNEVEEIQTIEDLRQPHTEAITAFRGQMQRKYNRYETNYGFICT